MKKLYFKPFEIYSEKRLLIVGILITILGTLLASSFNCRFDGFFDMHTASAVSFKDALLYNGINIVCMSLFLFLSTLWINKKTRFIDILNTSTIARVPLYILPFFNMNNIIDDVSEEVIRLVNSNSITEISSISILTLTAFSIVSILMLIWCIKLLFNGFKVSSNAKGGFHTILFISAIIFAEILSKFLIIKLV